MKKHDWILETLNNPTFSATDFKAIGMSTADTQLLPIDDYLKSSYITNNPLFKNDSGEFSKDKFTQFYNLKANDFKTFSEDYDTFLYDLFDPRRKVDSLVKSPNFMLTQVSNPQHSTIGIGGRNEVRDGQFTNKELAQRNKIFDIETGLFLDKSVNDYAFTKDPLRWISLLFEDPVVYATWDEDGEHIDPVTHLERKHRKGEFKINLDGEYYTEKLGNRPLRGKEVVSVFDNITVDGTGINKYDFFDADGFDKSVTGSLFSAAATIAPLFGGPWIAGIYSGLLIAREFGKALPMLGSMIDGLFGTDLENNSVFKGIAVKGQQYTGGTSQYSREHLFTVENIAKLVGDVATLWGTQLLIAKGVNTLAGGRRLVNLAYSNAQNEYLTRAMLMLNHKEFKSYFGTDDINKIGEIIKSGKWAETAVGKATLEKYLPKAQELNKKINRVGADAALAYMAIVSNTDVYDLLLEHGASKGEAALFSFFSTVGMYGVDRYAHLGEMFFDELADHSGKFVKRNLTAEIESVKNKLNLIANSSEPKLNKLQSIILTAKDFGAKYANNLADSYKYHTAGFAGKALGEALEEVSEELVTDFTKTLYELLGNYGITSTNDVGAWDNALGRYAMSFLGGAMGGGIFYGVGMYNGQYPLQTRDEDILYHIRNGKLNDYLKLVDLWENEGRFGSKELSATDFTETTDESGTKLKVYLTASSESDSLNHFIAEKIREGLKSLNTVINGNQLNLGEDQLFEKMVALERRYLDLRDWLQKDSYITGYFEVYLKLVEDIVKVELDLERAAKTKEGDPGGTSISDEWRRNNRESVEGKERSEKLQKLIDKKNELLKLKEEFLSGDTSYYYTRKMLFALDRRLSSEFFPNTFDEWVLKNKKVDAGSLNEIDEEEYRKEYYDYQATLKKRVLDEEFAKFLEMEKLVAPDILLLEENAKDFNKTSKIIDKLFTEDGKVISLLLNDMIFEDQHKFEGETDEDLKKYVDIMNKNPEVVVTEEDLEWFQLRRDKILEYNQLVMTNAWNNLLQIVKEAGGKIDPIAYRKIISNITSILNTRRKDVLDNIINYKFELPIFPNASYSTILEIKLKLSKVTEDNLDLTIDDIIKLIVTPLETRLKEQGGSLGKVLNILGRYEDNFGEDHLIDDVILDLLTPKENESELDKKFREEELAAVQNYIDEVKSRLTVTNEEGEEVSRFPEETVGVYLDLIDEDFEPLRFDRTAIGNEVRSLVDDVLLTVKQDEFILMADLVKLAVKLENPFIKFVAAIGNKIGLNDIEEQLLLVFDLMENADSLYDFRLTTPLIEEFAKVDNALRLVGAYLYAASNLASAINPYGHNKAINDFIKNHSSEMQKVQDLLPELSNDAYALYIHEAELYLKEINNRIQLHQINVVNKAQKFLKSDTAFVEARLESLKAIRDHLKFNLNGKDVDLFDGFEVIGHEDDHTTKLNLLEELLFVNFLNLLKELSLEDILKNSNIILKLLESTDLDRVDYLLSTPLDENLKYDKFTKYDRFIHLLTSLSLNNRDWTKFLKSEVSASKDKVPLTVLLYVARVGTASITKSSIMNLVLNYILENKLLKLLDLAFLSNSMFLPGIGGAGKTSVSAKYIADYAIDVEGIKEESLWYAAPTKDLVNNLKKSLTRGIGKTKEELMGIILDPTTYEELMKHIRDGKTDSLYYTIKVLSDGTEVLHMNWDNIKLNETSVKPELLIVDEVTHFSNAELQIIDKWTKAIYTGDPNLSGFKHLGGNINREKTFTIRTPKLNISLRDNNLLNYENLTKLYGLLDYIANAEVSSLDYDNIASSFIKAIDEFKMRVHNGLNLNGTLYLRSLTEDIVAKFSGDVAFVGDASSPALSLLKSKGITPKVFKNAEKIQGSEFDYVVIDYDFTSKYLDAARSTSSIKDKSYFYFNMANELYTLISRARTGSVIIDNGTLPGANTFDKFAADAASIMDALEQFKEPFNKSIDKYLATTLPISLEETEETKKKRTTSKKKEDVKYNPEEEESHPTDDGVVTEIDSESEHLIQLGEVTYPVYTRFTTVGARRTIKTVDGKDYQVWHPANEGETKRDIEIFLKETLLPETSLSDYFLKRNQLLGNLRSLINGILYNDSYSTVVDHIYGETPITEETYNKLKENIKLEVREIDPDRDIILLLRYKTEKDSDPTVTPISGNLSIFLVAEADGVKLTIGLFADPANQTSDETIKKLENSILKSIDRIDEIIDLEELPKGDPRELEYRKVLLRLAEKKKNAKADALKYAEAVADIISKPIKSYKINLTMNGFSRIFRLDNPISLSNYRKNRDVVISKPFIYKGNIPGVLDSMKGRAVVLVSGDNNVSESLLIGLYEAQKAIALDPELLVDTPAKVRMLALSSQGLDLTDILTRKVLAPLAWSQVGLKMLVSAWNFRANLSRFLKEYNNFLTENGYKTEDVLKVLVNMDIDYYKSIDPDYKATKYDVDNEEEIAKKIQEFNDGLAIKVKQFRLGGREEILSDGTIMGSLYIRKITNLKDNNIFYTDKDNTYGVYITPERADSFMLILDVYFDSMLDVITLADYDMKTGTKIEGKSLDKGTLISMSNEAANNINNYISKLKENKFVLTLPNGQKTEFVSEKGAWNGAAIFALGTLKLLRHINKVATGAELDEDADNYVDIKVKYGDETIYLPTEDILKKVRISGEPDLVFEDLFHIIVHGTTKHVNDRDNNPKATDAYFKKGIFVEQLKGKSVNNNFDECITDEAFFDVNGIVTSPTIQLTIELMKTEVKEEEPSEEEPIISTEELEFIGKALPFGINFAYKQNKSYDENKKRLLKSIKDKIRLKINETFNTASTLEDLDIAIEVDEDTLTLTYTLRSFIEEKSKHSLDNILNIERSENEIVITVDDVKLNIKYNSNARSLDKKIIVENSDSGLLTIPNELNDIFNKVNDTLSSIKDDAGILGIENIQNAISIIEGKDKNILKEIVNSIVEEINNLEVLRDFDDNIELFLESNKDSILQLRDHQSELNTICR